jgi:hypothetical protein
MKRRIVQALLMLTLALLPFAVNAQSVVTGSAFQVQNLSEVSAATIQITYYNADGLIAATQTTLAGGALITIPAGGSLTFYDGFNGSVAIGAPAGFRGSVVISSDQPIAAITNLTGASLGESYSGFSTGAQVVGVPLIMRGNSGYNTSLTIQNVGSLPTTVTVTYTPGSIGTAASDSGSIPPGASLTFDQTNKTELGTTFIGSASISATAGGSIVAIVNETTGTNLLTYNGFTGGATSIAVPLLFANNSGFYTGLTVQNIGGQTASVTITYTPNVISTASDPNACGTPPAKLVSLDAGKSANFIQAAGGGTPSTAPFDDFFATCRYVGGATISNATQPLVAIVNEITTQGNQSSSYESFSVAAATNTIKIPQLQANNSGIYSSSQVLNVGGAPASVTITYGANSATGDGVCGALTPRTVTIANGGSFTFQQAGNNATAGLNTSEGTDGQFTTCRFVGSATISAPVGSKIVAIANILAPTTIYSDGLFTYNGFNVTP